MTNNPNLRRYVERRYNRLSFFVLHLIFAVTLAAVVFITPEYRDSSTPAIGMLWFGLLLYHGVKVYIDSARDRAIERTMQQPYYDAEDEKPKRSTRLADLTDYDEPEIDSAEVTDGELPLWKR